MSGASYPIATLRDMTQIPEEALPRFLAELPTILAEARRIFDAHDAINATLVNELGFNLEIGVPQWVDDDLNQFTTTLSSGDEVLGSAVINRGSR